MLVGWHILHRALVSSYNVSVETILQQKVANKSAENGFRLQDFLGEFGVKCHLMHLMEHLKVILQAYG